VGTVLELTVITSIVTLTTSEMRREAAYVDAGDRSARTRLPQVAQYATKWVISSTFQDKRPRARILRPISSQPRRD
jgi:hypothetical protein